MSDPVGEGAATSTTTSRRPGTRPRLAEASRTTAAAINDLVAATRRAGHDDLADQLIDASKRWPEPHATLVAVGEAGAGRTTVVNALVGRLDPPLLPLGGSLTLVRTGAEEEVRAHTPGHPPRVGTLADPPEILPTDSVEVIVRSIAAGDQLVLVDAPPAGPAGDPRRRVIDALVATADGVILATRADAPITAPEVDLLRAARARTGAALVVTTRIDRHRGWRTVLDESRATIQASDPSLANVEPLPLAAPLAADAIAAREAGEPDADDLAGESGLAALLDAVRSGITNDLRYLRLRSLAELGRGIADELLLESEATSSDASTSPEATAAELQARARRLREQTSPLLVRLSDEFTLLRESVAVEVGREISSVTAEVNATLRHEKDIVLVADLAEQMLEAARIGLDERTDRRVEQIVREVLGEIAELAGVPAPTSTGDDEPTAVETDGDSDDEASGRTADGKRRPGRVTASMRLRLVQALLSSTGGVAMLAVIGGTGGGAVESVRFGALGVGMLVGGISAAEGIRETKRQRTSQDAKTKLRSVTDHWRADYLAAVRERLLREQRAQETALREAIRHEIEQLDARATEVQKGVAGAGASAAVPDLRALRQRLDDLARELG